MKKKVVVEKSLSMIECMVECAMIVALSTVLSLVKIIQMPWGGSVTLLSMLPICIYSVRRGIDWGLVSAFIFSVIQVFLGGALGWGLDANTLVICILFDYILPYTLLGLSGIFRKKGDFAIIGATAATLVLRFACHYVTGVTIWKNLEPWKMLGIESAGNAPMLYSLVYNGAYMLPEIVFTLIALVIIIKIPVVRKNIIFAK